MDWRGADKVPAIPCCLSHKRACRRGCWSGPKAETTLYRENFLYLIFFGISESAPSRRILSAS